MPDPFADGTVVVGRNAVTEALRAGRAIDKLYLAKGGTGDALRRIASQAREAGAVVVETDARALDSIGGTRAHQGVVALAALQRYANLPDILEAAAASGAPPLVVVCDGINDPHNLGAIIRSAEAAGAHGVVIPKRRSAPVTASAIKASAGAAAHMAIARVPNIGAALAEMKRAGLWVFGAMPDGATPLWEADLSRPAAIVIGSEGDGVRRLTAEGCDYRVKIPMLGKIQSLNASVSAALMLYEAMRRRAA